VSLYQLARAIGIVGSAVRKSEAKKVRAVKQRAAQENRERLDRIRSLKREVASIEKQIEAVRDDYRTAVLAEALGIQIKSPVQPRPVEGDVWAQRMFGGAPK
jgi:hypothetical protein